MSGTSAAGCTVSIPTGGPRESDEDEVGGSMGIVGALEQVGGYDGVLGCIGGVK